jgi:hypothetical protein
LADQRAVFAPPPGTILGETDYSIPGQWSASDNVRYDKGKAQPIGGWQLTSTLTSTSDGVVQMLEWYSKDGTRRLALAGMTSVKVLYGSTLGSIVDITPAGFVGTNNNRWTLDLWGDHLIACLTGGKVYEWDLVLANDLTAITNAPTVNTVALVTDQRQVMLLGTQQIVGAAFNPRAIRWSKTQDNQSWDPTVTLLTGEYVLDGSGGAIRGSKKIGTGIAVWTDDELFLGRYTGNTENLWVFERQAIGCGSPGESTATTADGVAYWITPDLRLMYWIPGSVPQEIPNLPEYYFSGNNLGFTYGSSLVALSFVWHNRKFNEIWFHVTVGSGGVVSTYSTNYVALNIPSLRAGNPQWFPGTLPRQSMYQGITGIYGWSAITGKLYTHETGYRGDTNERLACSISSMVYIDEGRKRVMVKGMVPDIEAQRGNLTLTLSALDYPQGAETTVKTQTLAVGDDKADFRASGKLIRVTLSSNDGLTGAVTDTFWRFGKNEFPYVVLGDR